MGPPLPQVSSRSLALTPPAPPHLPQVSSRSFAPCPLPPPGISFGKLRQEKTLNPTPPPSPPPPPGISMGKFQQEKTPEQELMEKRRQMPFHMHITLELLESVTLLCAMLLEVPNMAANPLNPKKKILSKSFHRILDQYNRQVGALPPPPHSLLLTHFRC